MTFQFREARRENVPLLIGIAGPSGAGKTMSALLLAKGLSGGKPFAFVDTESGRALHYADDFDFLHTELDAPFSPERYGQAIQAAAAINPPVIVVDSFSHEHVGEGGVLDMHEAELKRMAGDDYKRREAMKFAAWVRPKAAHKRLIQDLLRLRTHLIVCLRAEEKVDIVKKRDEQSGRDKIEVVPKRTLAGHVGWIPVCGKELPYELALSLVVTPDHPGVPKPIKLPEQFKPFVPLDRPLDENVGRQLAAWAAGSAGEPSAGTVDENRATAAPASTDGAPSPDDKPASPAAQIEELKAELFTLLDAFSEETGANGRGTVARAAESRTEQQMVNWLKRQIETARANLEAKRAEEGESAQGSMFEQMLPPGVRGAA
jgi:hypothetical protein